LCCSDQSRITPVKQELEIGENGGFYCQSLGINSWFFNGEKLPINVEIQDDRGAILLIKEATQSNAGYYECRGINEESEKFRSEGELTIIGSEASDAGIL